MAKVTYGKGATEYGPGVEINLTGDEVAIAIDAYLVAHRIYVNGPRTITVNGELCKVGRVYVDPSGFVIHDGKRYSGRGPEHTIVQFCTQDGCEEYKESAYQTEQEYNQAWDKTAGDWFCDIHISEEPDAIENEMNDLLKVKLTTYIYKTIAEMKPGEIGYVVPWAMTKKDGVHYLYGDYDMQTMPSGTMQMKVKRTRKGFVAQVESGSIKDAK